MNILFILLPVLILLLFSNNVEEFLFSNNVEGFFGELVSGAKQVFSNPSASLSAATGGAVGTPMKAKANPFVTRALKKEKEAKARRIKEARDRATELRSRQYPSGKFDFEDQTEENILQSDNWCNCDKTCKLENMVDSPDAAARLALGKPSKTAGTAGVKDLNDTCDINYNFVEGVTKTDNKQNDLVDYCDGCLDILNIKCRPNNLHKNSSKDPIEKLDMWCRRALKVSATEGSGVLKRCENTTGRGDGALDQLIEYMGFGYGPHQILPCPANQNPYQRWPRRGRYARSKSITFPLGGLPEIR